MATDLYKGVNAQFDVARKRAAAGEAANLQGQKDALARRSAQLGGGPSGALVKVEQQAGDESAKRLQDTNEGIDAAQAGEHRRIGEVLQGQEFARGERIGSQGFAAEQAAIQRKYGTSEREAGQAFGTKEREAGQTFSAAESKKALDAAFAQQKAAIQAAASEGKLNRDQEAAKLEELKRQYDTDTKKNDATNAISTILSAHNSGIAPDAIGQLLAGLGIDVGSIVGLTEAAPPQQGYVPSAPSNAPPSGAGAAPPGMVLKYYQGKPYWDYDRTHK